jgi:flagellar basal body-associated protein FliL
MFQRERRGLVVVVVVVVVVVAAAAAAAAAAVGIQESSLMALVLSHKEFTQPHF